MNLRKARKIVIVLVFVIDTVVMKSTIQKVLNIVCVLNFQPWSFTRIEADLNYLGPDEPFCSFNHGSFFLLPPLPQLTTMFCKEFTHACELGLVCPYSMTAAY
jgi:hypothetical protein